MAGSYAEDSAAPLLGSGSGGSASLPAAGESSQTTVSHTASRLLHGLSSPFGPVPCTSSPPICRGDHLPSLESVPLVCSNTSTSVVIRRPWSFATAGPPILPPMLRMPEDAARLIVDLAAGSLMELLATALVDRQFHQLCQQRFAHELQYNGVTTAGISRHGKGDSIAQVLSPQVAVQFVTLPSLELTSPGIVAKCCDERPLPSVFAPFNDEEALYHCHTCNTPILKVADIISQNYRIMTGRAYLTSAAYNVKMSEDSHEAHYTTGQYAVRHVACTQCDTRVGITYIAALDRPNQYKIGKFLVGQHLFVRPACCQLRTRPFSDASISLCPRCSRNAVRGVLQLVDNATQKLSVPLTRQLYSLLQVQNDLEKQSGPRSSAVAASGRGSGRVLAAPRAFVARCLPMLRPIGLQGATAPRAGEQRLRLGCPQSFRVCPRIGRSDTPTPTGLPVKADEWQDALKKRLEMLTCFDPSVHQHENIHSVLGAAVRFVGAVCKASRHAVPTGCNLPERVPLLLQMLPALVSPGRTGVLRGARALMIALQREWLIGNGPSGALSPSELDAIVKSLSALATRPQSKRPSTSSYGPPGSPISSSGRMSSSSSPGSFPRSPPSGPESSFELEEAMQFEDECDAQAEGFLQCLVCSNPLLKTDDIVSSDYRVQTGPAYLVSSAYNVSVAEETQEAVYTTGQYSIKDVSCLRCRTKLGITYVAASDESNQYKLGKFLVAQEHLFQPPSSNVEDKATLCGQLYELLRAGNTVGAPSPLLPQVSEREYNARNAVAASNENDNEAEAENQDEATPLANNATPPPAMVPVLAPRQRLIVIIKRYIRCILPVVQYTPAATDVSHHQVPASARVWRNGPQHALLVAHE